MEIIVCGDKDFISIAHAANHQLDIVGDAVSPTSLLDILDALNPMGVLIQATADWANNIIPIAESRKNVHFFISGNIKKAWLDQIAPAGIIVLPKDLNKAMFNMASALERVSPTAFRYTDNKVELKLIQKQTGLMTKACTLFYSSKGGVGKTTTTANIAAVTGMLLREINEEQGREYSVCVIDANPDGNIKHHFGYPPFSDMGLPKSIVGFKDLHENSSLNAVIERLNYHETTNVYFITSPETSHEKLANSPEIFDLCLKLAKKYFTYVYVDMGTYLNYEEAVSSVDAATDIMLVSNLKEESIGVLKQRMLEMNQVFGGFSRVKLVINNNIEEGRMNLKTALKELNLPLHIELPYCSNIRQGINKGVPAAALYPSDKYAEQIKLLAQKIIGTSFGTEAKKGKSNKSVSWFSKIKQLFS